MFIGEINTDDIEREYKNPIYGETSSSTTLLQDGALPGQDNAQTQIIGDVYVYDVLNREQPTGTIIDSINRSKLYK